MGQQNKKWYQSKTKVGAVLGGASIILGTLAGWFSGTIDSVTAIHTLAVEVSGVLLILGIRDLPILNKL